MFASQVSPCRAKCARRRRRAGATGATGRATTRDCPYTLRVAAGRRASARCSPDARRSAVAAVRATTRDCPYTPRVIADRRASLRCATCRAGLVPAHIAGLDHPRRSATAQGNAAQSARAGMSPPALQDLTSHPPPTRRRHGRPRRHGPAPANGAMRAARAASAGRATTGDCPNTAMALAIRAARRFAARLCAAPGSEKERSGEGEPSPPSHSGPAKFDARAGAGENTRVTAQYTDVLDFALDTGGGPRVDPDTMGH